MFRIVTVYGLIGGVVVAVPMIALMLTTPKDGAPNTGMLVTYLTMIIALTAVFLGIKHYRDKVLGGVIKFGTAFLLGLGISAVASILYVIGWEVSIALTGYDFAGFYSNLMVESARAKGATGDALQKAIAEADAFVKMYNNPLYRLPMVFVEMFPVGVLISVISAAVLRNSRVLPARAS